ncbi:hypothetical protein ALC62_13231 [Cyphomyrmex costatus]|uniref:Uncharacterized protein n=1 Tax=Cyphomyrmex costatus TaxID=456900 RepID=A0A195C5Q0_9HYME|nr:hypothetical protein ALC62_13231 [Cyphomyrmex costatus]
MSDFEGAFAVRIGAVGDSQHPARWRLTPSSLIRSTRAGERLMKAAGSYSSRLVEAYTPTITRRRDMMEKRGGNEGERGEKKKENAKRAAEFRAGSWALYVIQPSIHRRVPVMGTGRHRRREYIFQRSAFFPSQAKHRGYGTALTLRDTQRVLVFYAVHRESDWREAINRNVLAGKCKLSAKPRFETMLLVMNGVGFSEMSFSSSATKKKTDGTMIRLIA